MLFNFTFFGHQKLNAGRERSLDAVYHTRSPRFRLLGSIDCHFPIDFASPQNEYKVIIIFGYSFNMTTLRVRDLVCNEI